MNKAFLVGINEYPSAPLRGCVDDIQDMADFLVKDRGFVEDNIRLLVDGRATTSAILERLKWLVSDVREGDQILFHYSGHGAQVPTRSPHGEVDGLDEVICPVDFDWTDEHLIRDKNFIEIFAAVPKGVTFIWVSESCHSGDLSRGGFEKYYNVPKRIVPPVDIAWRAKTAKTKNIKPTTLSRSATELNVALIAGCKSDQTSADATFENRANGALSYYLLKQLKNQKSVEPLSSLIVKVADDLSLNGYAQSPQLEGSPEIMNAPFLVTPI